MAILPCRVGIACEAERNHQFADIYMTYNFLSVREITNFSKVSREMTAEISARQRDHMQAAKQAKYLPHIGNNLVILPPKVGIAFELSNPELGYCSAD